MAVIFQQTGSSVTRYTTADPINTNTVTDANTSISGTLTAIFNNVAAGAVTFTAGGDGAGTYTDLIVVNDGDAHDEISASTYPTGFAKFLMLDGKEQQVVLV